MLLDVIAQKCAFKNRGIPALEELEPHRGELEQLWADMLAHQLPMLPPYDQYWDELPGFFAWLGGGKRASSPVAYVLGAGETVLRERLLRLNVRADVQAMIEVIRFAAANRLAVDLDYDGHTRRIEPYSLRRTRDDHIVLHAVRSDTGEHRSYRIDRMQGARATNQMFVPRHEIELAPKGPVRIAPSAARDPSALVRSATPRPPGRARSAPSSPPLGQPKYAYQCPMCQKKFNRSTIDAKLNSHKDKWGNNCSGRVGYLVSIR